MKKFILPIYFVAIVVVIVGIFFSVCSKQQPPSDHIEGEVIIPAGDFGNIQANAEFDGLVSYSNETLKINTSDVVFTVKTELGKYTIQLDPTGEGGSSGPQTVKNMKFALRKGVKIKFPTNYHGKKNPDNRPMGFSKSKIGIVDPGDIDVLQ